MVKIIVWTWWHRQRQRQRPAVLPLALPGSVRLCDYSVSLTGTLSIRATMRLVGQLEGYCEDPCDYATSRSSLVRVLACSYEDPCR